MDIKTRWKLSCFMIRVLSRDPADGSSKGQARVGFLHLQGWDTGAWSEAGLQTSEDEGDHSGWVLSTEAHLSSPVSSGNVWTHSFTEELYNLLADYCAIQQTSGTFNVKLFDFIKTCYLCSEKPSKSLLWATAEKPFQFSQISHSPHLRMQTVCIRV